MSLESKFQAELIKKIEDRLPGVFILKNDPSHIQGIPDLTILFEDRWATLEVKRSIKDRLYPEPNQEHYVNTMNQMSYSAFVYPEIEEDILNELQHALTTKRPSCVSKRI